MFVNLIMKCDCIVRAGWNGGCGCGCVRMRVCVRVYVVLLSYILWKVVAGISYMDNGGGIRL